jgi:hypothetical protein
VSRLADRATSRLAETRYVGGVDHQHPNSVAPSHIAG